MIFIHHYQDSEHEEKPPPEIRRVARRTCYEAGQIAVANIRIYVPTDKPQMDQVRTSSIDCGSDYWEIVIEDGDLRALTPRSMRSVLFASTPTDSATTKLASANELLS